MFQTTKLKPSRVESLVEAGNDTSNKEIWIPLKWESKTD